MALEDKGQLGLGVEAVVRLVILQSVAVIKLVGLGLTVTIMASSIQIINIIRRPLIAFLEVGLDVFFVVALLFAVDIGKGFFYVDKLIR